MKVEIQQHEYNGRYYKGRDSFIAILTLDLVVRTFINYSKYY